MEKVLCLDIGASSIKSGLVDINGSITEEKTTGIKNDYESFLESVDYILNTLDKKPAGISIALPGAYDIENDVIFAPNLTSINGRHIKTDIENKYKIEVRAENDANLAALGEYIFIEKKQIDNMVFCTLGSGFGGGLILNGRLLQSKITLFEIGHISIDFNGRLCGCGRKGCLDEYCSSSGLISIYEKKSGSRKSVREIKSLAENSDRDALETLSEFGRILGGAFANLTALFCPDKIKFGGGISELSEYYLNDCIDEYNKVVFPAYRNRVKIERAGLKNKAGILGASSLFFNH